MWGLTQRPVQARSTLSHAPFDARKDVTPTAEPRTEGGGHDPATPRSHGGSQADSPPRDVATDAGASLPPQYDDAPWQAQATELLNSPLSTEQDRLLGQLSATYGLATAYSPVQPDASVNIPPRGGQRKAAAQVRVEQERG